MPLQEVSAEQLPVDGDVNEFHRAGSIEPPAGIDRKVYERDGLLLSVEHRLRDRYRITTHARSRVVDDLQLVPAAAGMTAFERRKVEDARAARHRRHQVRIYRRGIQAVQKRTTVPHDRGEQQRDDRGATDRMACSKCGEPEAGERGETQAR